MSDYGNSLNNLHQLLSEYISNIRNYLMNAASHNRYYKNVVHGHKNNNSEKNLAIIKPLKPPKFCVECFHTLFNQNNPHIPGSGISSVIFIDFKVCYQCLGVCIVSWELGPWIAHEGFA